MDSKVLRPFETEEDLWDIESAFRRGSEEEAAVKGCQISRIDLTRIQKAIDTPRPLIYVRNNLPQKLASARATLDAVTRSLNTVKRRNDLIDIFAQKTRDYKTNTRKADYHKPWLRWILEQVPLVEAELNESKATQGSLDVGRGRKRSRCHLDDKATNTRCSKKQKRHTELSLLSDHSDPSTAYTERRSKRSHQEKDV